jgi:hypothetical protein
MQNTSAVFRAGPSLFIFSKGMNSPGVPYMLLVGVAGTEKAFGIAVVSPVVDNTLGWRCAFNGLLKDHRDINITGPAP